MHKDIKIISRATSILAYKTSLIRLSTQADKNNISSYQFQYSSYWVQNWPFKTKLLFLFIFQFDFRKEESFLNTILE